MVSFFFTVLPVVQHSSACVHYTTVLSVCGVVSQEEEVVSDAESFGVLVPVSIPSIVPETAPAYPLPQYPVGAVFPGQAGKFCSSHI